MSNFQFIAYLFLRLTWSTTATISSNCQKHRHVVWTLRCVSRLTICSSFVSKLYAAPLRWSHLWLWQKVLSAISRVLWNIRLDTLRIHSFLFFFSAESPTNSWRINVQWKGRRVREHIVSRLGGERHRKLQKSACEFVIESRRVVDKRAIILGAIAIEHVAANCRY